MKKILLLILCLATAFITISCTSDTSSNTYTYEMTDSDWRVEIDNGLEVYKDEVFEDVHYVTFNNEDNLMVSIGEVLDPDAVIDADTVLAEFGSDDYVVISAVDSLELEDGTVFYGVFGEDHSTESYFVFYTGKVGDKVISFMAYKMSPMMEEEGQMLEEMINSFEKI